MKIIESTSGDMYTINNCIDDILKEDEIASLNVGLLTQNMFTESSK